MFVVRFVALIALAVWLGSMVAPIWPTNCLSCDLGRETRALGYACGGIVLVSLFMIKFLGPPPRQFPLRAGTVALMLLVAVYADYRHVTSMAPTAINLVLALMLLSWYARE
jgi:hypothetical protein